MYLLGKCASFSKKIYKNIEAQNQLTIDTIFRSSYQGVWVRTAENIVAIKIKCDEGHTIKYDKKFDVCNYCSRGFKH